jgi:hypothetical protein
MSVDGDSAHRMTRSRTRMSNQEAVGEILQEIEEAPSQLLDELQIVDEEFSESVETPSSIADTAMQGSIPKRKRGIFPMFGYESMRVTHTSVAQEHGSGQDDSQVGQNKRLRIKGRQHATTAQKIQVLDWHNANGRVQTKTAAFFQHKFKAMVIKQPSISKWVQSEKEIRDEYKRDPRRAKSSKHVRKPNRIEEHQPTEPAGAGELPFSVSTEISSLLGRINSKAWDTNHPFSLFPRLDSADSEGQYSINELQLKESYAAISDIFHSEEFFTAVVESSSSESSDVELLIDILGWVSVSTFGICTLLGPNPPE